MDDDHAFGSSTPFSLGVEEELFLVDPVTGEQIDASRAVLQRIGDVEGTVERELHACQVELITRVCSTASEAADALRGLRKAVGATGAGLLGAGLHPAAREGLAEITDKERYAHIRHLLGDAVADPTGGLHVHVGMPDPETAIRASNGMRKWVPTLAALGANSPFWHGRDSGLASTRAALLRSFPRTGVPRAFRSYEDFLGTVADVTAAGALRDYTTIWWDLRVHPRLGTLEVRVPDVQTSIAEAGALAALIHCLVIHEATSPPEPGPSAEQIDECAFRALRDGRRAELYFEGRLQPLNEIVAIALQRVRGVAPRLGCAAELRTAERMAAEGNGADRQRAVFAAGGMGALLRHLAAETAAGRPLAALAAGMGDPARCDARLVPEAAA